MRIQCFENGEESQGLFKLRLSSYEGLKLFNDILSTDTNFNIFNKKSKQDLRFLKPKLNFIFNRHFFELMLYATVQYKRIAKTIKD